ncbi:hypothetical protein ON003_00345 [Janibacter hoylei]|uniref:hypothetical protein n=1 Tax=Janibacter hoylei TaxID=364298 RepID=UPI0022389A23|nr:hypothetical protein [Janibacter hoylei]MCW4600232.1 hypothetical protein [Janibacter hoylei]
MATTTTRDPVLEELAGVVWRLWQAADQALAAIGPDSDFELYLQTMAVRDAACHGADLMGDQRRLCDVPASTELDPRRLIREAEQVLAARPIEQWPVGTSGLVVDVCDLVREFGR